MRYSPLIVLLACHGADSDTGPTVADPEYACPGGEGCAGNDGALQAGVAVRSILPQCFESWTDSDGDFTYNPTKDTFLDCGCDRLCSDNVDYPGPDSLEGDGTFQAAYLAGFGNGRAATGVRGAAQGLAGEGDGLWARAIVLKQGDTSLALVSVDMVGWFYDDVLGVRELVKQRGVDVDHVIIDSTHTHQAVDTMGLWGRAYLRSGYTNEHRLFLQDTIATAIAEAAEAAVPVTMVLGGVAASDYDSVKGTANVGGDTRDPYVVIDDVGAAQFVDANGDTVGTLVNWACHPETRADENTLLSSDFVHALRKTVETGSHWNARQTPGVGGTAIYLNGAVGGMMTALHLEIDDPDGGAWRDASWEKTDAQGILVGEMALDALARGETVTDAKLSFQARELHVPVDNQAFQTMFLAEIFQRQLYDWDDTQNISSTNLPYVRTEVDRVDLGPLQLMTVPGEVLPELFIGGYDGSEIHSPGVTIVQATNENPPDLTQAPPGPYWKDAMTGERRWMVGLANDELGYVIPPYNFEVSTDLPWFDEAEGDHYEETNSLGPQMAPLLDVKLRELFDWSR